MVIEKERERRKEEVVCVWAVTWEVKLMVVWGRNKAL
jgi:hypothetical protein